MATTKTATIFGMNVNVASWIWVSAWNREMAIPTAIAAPIIGPLAKMTAQMADLTRSIASAWFMAAYEMTTPEASSIVLPSASVATEPEELISMEAIVPEMVPSADVTVFPMSDAPCEMAVCVSNVSNRELALTSCSTDENDASCEINCVGSVGSVGS